MNNESFVVTRKSEIEISLADYQGEDSPHLKCKISIEPYGIAIAFEGYGEYTSEKGGAIIFIEQIEGVPRMLIWDDINKEDSVQEIGFEGAREELRQDYSAA
jgi:hypothetical protein